ncbi:MAG: hypothetical protein EON93_16660, partial [Burkholderiales bacterium]
MIAAICRVLIATVLPLPWTAGSGTTFCALICSFMTALPKWRPVCGRSFESRLGAGRTDRIDGHQCRTGTAGLSVRPAQGRPVQASADKMGISEILSSRSGRLHSVPVLGASVMMHLALAVAASPALGASARPNLAEARSWGYQLQMVDPYLVADSPYDLMVIDYARDGSGEQAFSRSEVMAMKRKPDGGSRIVLAYLSIGEAEDYRFYWNRSWQTSPPDWLGRENPDWPGNYAVHYWDRAWQSVILGGPDAYLDSIIAAGFDGVYLDRIDAFDVSDAVVSRASRMQKMVEFVSTIATYARSEHPGFIIVGQNAEELLNYP